MTNSILCGDKDNLGIEYAIQNTNQSLGVATYSIGTELPKELRSFLPSSEEISEWLSVFNEKELDSNV